ncbi:MAG TPA: tetratricopeptide repeat protein [Pirellulales bacterium]|nr:tetratricopeptide repeat protein [Pirellulales bacterium]
MKAQHRHELQTNQLAVWLEHSGQRLKPYARAIVGVLVAAAIVLAVYTYLGSVERRANVAASDQFVSGLDALEGGMTAELQRTIDDYRGTQPATLAQLVKAEILLDNGANALYANKPAGRENIFNASDAFAAVDRETHDPMLRAWALYGLGRAHESMGDLDRARDDFQQLLKEYPDSSLAEAARTHVDRLNQPSVKEFYDWFAKQEPRPPAAENEPGAPGVKPSFNLDEPQSVPQGDVKLPSALSESPSGAQPAPGTESPSPAPSPAEKSPPAGASK